MMNRLSLSMGIFLMPMAIGLVPFADCVAFAAARSTHARTWERADANADGALSRDEARRMPRLARHFDVIDGDRDGAITGGEVRAWRESLRIRRRAMPGRGVDEIMKTSDLDGDGEISRAELAKAMPRFSPRFDRIDANGDGRLARKELADWLAARRPMRSLQKTGQ